MQLSGIDSLLHMHFRRSFYLPPDLPDQASTDLLHTRYYTPVRKYADYTSLNKIQPADVSVSATMDNGNRRNVSVTLENRSPFPAVFIRLNLVHQNKNTTPGHFKWAHVTPVKWSDNYVTLWPHERTILYVDVAEGAEHPDMLLVHGKNVHETEIPIIQGERTP